MRLIAVVAACVVALAGASVSSAQGPPPGKGKPDKEKPDKPGKGKDKPRGTNVEHLATLPAPAGVSANFKRDGDKTYMFVSTLTGLYVYDVTDGDAPALAGTLPLPHFQNEDVSIGGDRLLISTDGAAGGGILFEIDISEPATPRPVRAIKMEALGEGHTATCVDDDCRWVWVAGDQLSPGITVLDLEQAPQAGPADADASFFGFRAPGTSMPAVVAGDLRSYREFGWSTHDVHVDEAGVAWVAGGDGTIGFDVSNYGEEGDPLDPPVVARTGDHALNDGDMFDGPLWTGEPSYDTEKNEDTVNDFVHHNALRPDAGDTVLITEEDLYNRRTTTSPGGCETQGSFQTWHMEGGQLTPLDTWETELNELIANDEDPWGGDIVPTGGMCSAHYFDERDGMVAIAWYEQGVRLLDVSDPTAIEQVAYWLPEGAEMWSTYWSPTADDIVYAVGTRGLDVLRIGKGGEPVEAPIPLPDATARTSEPDPSYGWVCRIPTG